MQYQLRYAAVTCLLGCSIVLPLTASAQGSSTRFLDSKCGVRFSHTDQVSISYKPHSDHDLGAIAYHGQDIGGFSIRPAPRASSDDYIAMLREYFKETLKATSIDYTVYDNPHKYRFHVITARVRPQEVDYSVERYINIGDISRSTATNDAYSKSKDSSVMAEQCGLYTFEFSHKAPIPGQIMSEIRTIIDSFELTNGP